MACAVLLGASLLMLRARRREMREVAAGAARLFEVDRAMRESYEASRPPQPQEEKAVATEGASAAEAPPPLTPARPLKPVRTGGEPERRDAAGLARPESPADLRRRLDTAIESFRRRPLEAGPYRYVWLDALRVAVQERGRTAHVPALVATAMNAQGRREVVGFDATRTSPRVEWTSFLTSLADRGLSGVELVVSDDLPGVRSSVARTFDGAAWQCCRAHFIRALLSRVPKSAHASVGPLVRSIFAQPSDAAVEVQHAMVALELLARFPAAGELFDRAGEGIIAFRRFPAPDWPRIWSNEAHERRMRQIRREAADRDAVMRSLGERLLAQHDRWASGRRYAAPRTTPLPAVAVVPGAREEREKPPLAAVG